MKIKTIGTITENVGDGKTVKVAWEILDPPREWFFYTYRVTVVEADSNDALASNVVALVEQRMNALNEEIGQDRSLGPQYRIGHSYVTPQPGATIPNEMAWFKDIVVTEIVPLLEEYWFDAPDKVVGASAKLLEGL